MTGQQIYENFATAAGTASLAAAHDLLMRTISSYQDLQQEIGQAAAELEQFWQGDAAAAAHRGAGPLAVGHGRAAVEMNTAQALLSAQISAFHKTKYAVQPVPAVPAGPPSMLEVITTGDALSNYTNKVLAADDTARANVTAMDQWAAASKAHGDLMPTDYGSLDPGTPAVTSQSSKHPGSIRQVRGTSEPPRHTPPRGADHPETPNNKPKPADTPRPGPTPPAQPGTTNPAGHTPVSTTGENAAAALDTPSSARSSAALGRDSANLPVSATSSGTTAHPDTTGVVAPRPGSSTGRATPSSRSAPASRSAKPALGKAAGLAPLGPAKKKETEEHQRKYVVADDEPFRLIEDDGTVLDPRTGLPPTPPVIGV